MASGNKKTDDFQIIGLNSVGLSLGTIGKRLGVHHTTITARLKILGVPPADTRRAFMEDIFDGLSDAQREWLINQLGPTLSVKDFVKSLIVKDYIAKINSNGSK